MQSIILSLASRHALSTGEVIQEIESAFALQLSQWYRQDVMVFLREGMQLEVVAYSKKNGLPVQHILDLPAVLSRNQFKAILENHLAMATVIKQVRMLKSFERRLLWGEVVRSRADDHLLVETEIIPAEPIIAICPFNRIAYMNGMLAVFSLANAEPSICAALNRYWLTVLPAPKSFWTGSPRPWPKICSAIIWVMRLIGFTFAA